MKEKYNLNEKKWFSYGNKILYFIIPWKLINLSGGCKRILSPLTEHIKQKAWNKTREKYMLEERRQNLSETDRGSYYNQENG